MNVDTNYTVVADNIVTIEKYNTALPYAVAFRKSAAAEFPQTAVSMLIDLIGDASMLIDFGRLEWFETRCRFFEESMIRDRRDQSQNIYNFNLDESRKLIMIPE